MRMAKSFPRCSKLTAALPLLAVISIGCGAVRHPALERARERYQNARQDPEVVGRASVALDKAWLTLEQAERVWTMERDSTEVEHLAYVAEKRIEIARATARRRSAAEEIQQLKSQR
jgi:ABC-type branched-subunit amino acid transport system ATPase component